jgi:signal transduction histidine kinase
LRDEILRRIEAERKIRADQRQLRSLTAELVLAEERERHAAAMALHDSLGPILAFSKRELGILQKSVPQAAADTLKNIGENISQAVEQTRNLTFDLSPPALYTFGLETAVAELTEQFGKEQKLKIVFENTDEPKPLTDHIKILFYRSIREILINIAKHAEAKTVRVNLSRTYDKIKIVVQDDGKGFDVAGLESRSASTKGFGLFSIRERLTHIGGSFTIQSGRGRGTEVVLLAPLDIKEAKKEK